MFGEENKNERPMNIKIQSPFNTSLSLSLFLSFSLSLPFLPPLNTDDLQLHFHLFPFKSFSNFHHYNSLNKPHRQHFFFSDHNTEGVFFCILLLFNFFLWCRSCGFLSNCLKFFLGNVIGLVCVGFLVSSLSFFKNWLWECFLFLGFVTVEMFKFGNGMMGMLILCCGTWVGAREGYCCGTSCVGGFIFLICLLGAGGEWNLCWGLEDT